MAKVNGLGSNSIEEYKQFGEKIIAENKKMLEKSGVQVTVFNQDLTLSNNSSAVQEERVSDKKEDKPDTKNEKSDKPANNVFEDTSIHENKTLSNVRASNGMFNTAYKNGISANAILGSNSADNPVKVDELLSSFEEMDGSDDNDDIEDFLATEYEEGLHLNGGGYGYYENGSNSSIHSVSTSLSGSYKNKKLSLSYGGVFEYTDTVQKPEKTCNTEKNGNAVLMAKYNVDSVTFAGGGSAFIYNDGSNLYNISAGVMHDSGLAATLSRKIQVSKDAEGHKVISNQTSAKINILKPKKAGEFPNVIPDIPSPSEGQELDNLAKTNIQEVDSLINNSDYKTVSGFGIDLELATSSDSDEYGVVVKHTTNFKNKKDQQKIASITPYIGLYDYHPETEEGLKVRTGIEGNLNFTTGNNLNVNATAIIDNKRIMQPGSSPLNTYMTVLDTSVSKNNFSANVSAGYIDSGANTKYKFVTGGLTYNVKKSSISFVAGIQDCELATGEDKIFHTGLRFATTF